MHLLDFGLAVRVGARGRLVRSWRETMKTHPWYAQEYLRGRPVDAQTDIGALGHHLKRALQVTGSSLGDMDVLWAIVEGTASAEGKDRPTLAYIRRVLEDLIYMTSACVRVSKCF